MELVIKKLRNLILKSSVENTMDQNIDTMPVEIFDKIFSLLTVQERLKCRLLSVKIMKRIDQLYEHKIILRLSDITYKHYKPQRKHWNFTPSVMSIHDKLHKKISNQFFTRYIMAVKVVDISSTISAKNFCRVVADLPFLETLSLNSMALGHETIFPSPIFPSILPNSKPCSLQELRLQLDYIPSSEKYFCTQSLIANLLGMYQWNTPNLREIYIEIRRSTLYEQFYFTYDLLLSSIPRISYEVLKKLEIRSPRMRTFQSQTSGLRREIRAIQLSTLSIESTSSLGTFSPAVLTFIQNQSQLKTLILQIHSPLRNAIISELRKVNKGFFIE